jgi:hypothetical protein
MMETAMEMVEILWLIMEMMPKPPRIPVAVMIDVVMLVPL